MMAMNSKEYMAIALVILLLFFSTSPMIFYAKPFWIKEGVYVEYSINDVSVITRQFKEEIENQTITIHVWVFDILNGSYSWRVLDVKDGLAKVEVNFAGWIEYRKGPRETEKIHTVFVNRTVIIYLNTSSREALLDGRNIGAVPWWFTDLKKGMAVSIGREPYKVIGWVWTDKLEIRTQVMDTLGWGINFNETSFTASALFGVDNLYGILLKVWGAYFDPVLSEMLISIAVELGANLPWGRRPEVVSLLIRGVPMEISSFGGLKFERPVMWISLREILPILLLASSLAIPTYILIRKRQLKRR